MNRRRKNRLDLEEIRIKNDLQEVQVIMYCDKCMDEIYKGNDYYLVENETLCEDCFEKYQDEERKQCMKVAGE